MNFSPGLVGGAMGRQMSATANVALKRRIKFSVSGNFDGLDARELVSDVASKLRLSGFIRISPSGAPEGEAQGDEDKLNDFIQHIKSGLPAGEVTGVECSEVPAKHETVLAEYKNKLFGGGFQAF